MPLISLESVSIAYGHLPLLDAAELRIDAGERIAIIGRNGAGKSTLLQILSGDLPPDGGTVSRQPGTRTARLVQDVPLSVERSVFDVVAEGLGDVAGLVRDYHHAAVAVAHDGSQAALDTLGRLQHELEEQDGWRLEQRVEMVLTHLGLDAEARVDTLSGGWRRRVLLARALVGEPDVLLLDEPTNHLDIDSITWLEALLTDYQGAVVFVTHDRSFLQNVATRIVELDRGRLTSWPGDYAAFLEKKEEWLANEATQQAKFDKRLAGEEAWLRQGIKARRTRDEGRVKALLAMRVERAARREQVGTVRLQVERAEPSGRLVFEADGISKAFAGAPVVRSFSTRVMRGDRIGLIGANGSGKTTLLRMLLGELPPDSGEVRRGANVEVAYYDQQREQLDPEQTVFDTVGQGNDTVTVNGQPRHVHGYLRDFLFGPERARSPVKALSGGERNRLLLARLFTRPANVLVLDEPTNDLDIETLELLESLLVEWPGTLLLVSHDRTFLDNVVTSTIAFEGQGRVAEYVGGYADWLRQRPAAGGSDDQPLRGDAATGREQDARAAQDRGSANSPAARDATNRRGGPSDPPAGVAAAATTASAASSGTARKKLSYKETRELEALPAAIEALESEQAQLNADVAAPDFYKAGADAIAATLARVEAIQGELTAAYARWDELDSRSAKS